MQLQLIAALTIIFLIVVFAAQNAVAVSAVFFLWRVDASLATVTQHVLAWAPSVAHW